MVREAQWHVVGEGGGNDGHGCMSGDECPHTRARARGRMRTRQHDVHKFACIVPSAGCARARANK